MEISNDILTLGNPVALIDSLSAYDELAKKEAALESPAVKEITNGTEYVKAVNSLGLSPVDRVSFLQSLAYNVGNYKTSYVDKSSKRAIFQRLAGETFITNTINQNVDFISNNAIFAKFNFFTAPHTGIPGETFIALLSNGIYVAAEMYVDENNMPHIKFPVIKDDGSLGELSFGYAVVVAINKEYSTDTVEPIRESSVMEAAVPLVLDREQNKIRAAMPKEKRQRLEVKSSKKAIQARANAKAQRKARKATRK